MEFKLMTDEQIIEALGNRLESTRLHNGIKDKQVLKDGGVTSDALNKFRQANGGITLLNFVRLIRGVGELKQLEKLLFVEEEFSFKQSRTVTKRKRVVDPRNTKKTSFEWGEDK